MIENEIFKKSEFQYNKLLDYGFIYKNGEYKYNKYIMNGEFNIIISISNNKVYGNIMDVLGECEYTNYRVNYSGGFSLSIREEFIKLLKDIRDKCCINKLFVCGQANRISDLIKRRYGIGPEFIFKDNNTGVFRNIDNKKWFGIIMYIDYSKINDRDGMVNIINVKVDKGMVDSLVERDGIYLAYHMNKRSWVSISLDDSCSDEDIMSLVDKSYSFSVSSDSWVIPASERYFDVVSFIDNNDVFEWKRNKGIRRGDSVYIYISSPVSAIYCRTCVTSVSDSMMLLKVIERYPKDRYSFSVIKLYGLRAIRGPRRMPRELVSYISHDLHKNNI